jgi:dTDP-4-amino-4,6-dideoxygalactose transaminase
MSNTSQPIPIFDLNRANSELRDEVIQAFAAVYDSGKFLYGPQVGELETAVAALSNTQYAVGCASGSDALLLGLMALDIEPGDEVIVPSFTFFATASAVARLGAKIIFADIDPRTYNIDPQVITDKITSRTRAIIPVHLFGQSADMIEISKIAAGRDIPIIEDAAQAIGAAYHGRPVCSWGQMGCISFYPTKNLGGFGDGGMIAVNNDQLADRLRLLAGHGMRPRYHHREVGINSRLDTLQAAGLLAKIRRLDAYNKSRKEIADRYSQMLSDSCLLNRSPVELPYQDPAAHHVWNQYSLRVTDGRRDALRQHLNEKNVGSEIYYPIPLHEQECFRHLGYAPEDLPETHRASKEILHLPIYPGLTVDEQWTVVKAIEDFFAQSSQRVAA